MTAADTTRRVIAWASAPEGAPPGGEPFGLAGLAPVPPDVARALSGLAAITAARLGFGGFERRENGAAVEAGVAWLAAAVGLRHLPLAVEIVQCCPPPAMADRRIPWDVIARHGVVMPALAHVGEDLRAALLSASPLTALLTRPAGGGEDQALALTRGLIAGPCRHQPVIAAFADPGAGTAELEWRAVALDRLRHDEAGRGFALDVYETAVAWHGRHWLARVDDSARALALAPDDPPLRWREALAVGRWWRPLRRLRRSHADAIRARGYLDFNVYMRGLWLAGAVAALDGPEG